MDDLELKENSPQGQDGALGVEESCKELTRYLEDILRDAPHARLEAERLAEPCRELGAALESFRAMAEELADYSVQLSKGRLDAEQPQRDSCLYVGLKNLHGNLKQLVNQAGQVAAGDYSQQVSQLGTLSDAFNAMTRQLDDRRAQLRAEVRRAQNRADIIESYTEMLVDLLGQREEWMLVVDEETREIVYCNKRHQGNGQGGDHCETCKHRLPIQSKILEWERTERYKIWELEEHNRGGCYRIISFPIEWKERPSCVHIVMDVTAEKMNARHLSDDVYQDMDITCLDQKLMEYTYAQAGETRNEIDIIYEKYRDFDFFPFISLADELVFYLSCIHFRREYEKEGFYFTMPCFGTERTCVKGAYDMLLGVNLFKNGEGCRPVSNDYAFHRGASWFILTGANQGGKTTFIRSIGLIQCLAQTGMFVPAEEAILKAVGHIHTF